MRGVVRLVKLVNGLLAYPNVFANERLNRFVDSKQRFIAPVASYDWSNLHFQISCFRPKPVDAVNFRSHGIGWHYLNRYVHRFLRP